MCLAIPSKVIRIENNLGTIDVAGVTREASLMLLDDVEVGDYVLVHAGFAIQKIAIALYQKKNLKLKVPFGPFLSLGAITHVFFGPFLIRLYFNL